MLTLLAAHLERQRRRGRSAAVDALSGYAIEEGEAEGLIADLTRSLEAEAEPAGPGVPGPGIAAPALGPDDVGGLESTRPLLRAVRAFELTRAEYDALLLALAVELDGRFARLVAYLNDHVGRTRPTLGLAIGLAREPARLSVVGLSERPILRDGLLEREGEGPLSGQSLRVAQDLLARLVGDGGTAAATPAGVRHHPHAPALLDALVLPDEVRERLRQWAEDVRRGGTAPLLLSGAPGLGRGTAARAALAAAGRPMIEVTLAEPLPERLRAARREARWHAAGLLLRLPEDARPVDVEAVWSALAAFPLPVVMTGPGALLEAVAARAPREPLSLALTPPELEQRAHLWRRLLPEGELAAHEIDELAARFQFPPRTIARAIRRARGDGQGRRTLEGLARSCRELGNLSMSAIAQRETAVSKVHLPRAAILSLNETSAGWSTASCKAIRAPEE